MLAGTSAGKPFVALCSTNNRGAKKPQVALLMQQKTLLSLSSSMAGRNGSSPTFPIDCERETVLQESTTGAVLPVDTEGELVVIVNNKYISVSLSLLSCRQKCLHQEHEEPRKITLFLLNRGNGRKESTTNAAKVEQLSEASREFESRTSTAAC